MNELSLVFVIIGLLIGSIIGPILFIVLLKIFDHFKNKKADRDENIANNTEKGRSHNDILHQYTVELFNSKIKQIDRKIDYLIKENRGID